MAGFGAALWCMFTFDCFSFYLCGLIPRGCKISSSQKMSSAISTKLSSYYLIKTCVCAYTHSHSYCFLRFLQASSLSFYSSTLKRHCLNRMVSHCLFFFSTCVFRICCQRRWSRWWSGPPGARSSGWTETNSAVLLRPHPGTTLSSSCSQLSSLNGSVPSAGTPTHKTALYTYWAKNTIVQV